MTKIYAIANQKGGVGKTTSVVNLAAYIAASGRKVLVVDMDPQSNATSALGYNKYEVEKSSYDILMQEATAASAILQHKAYGLDILPAHPELAGAEVELVNTIGREYRLQTFLEEDATHYDYVLIDCPPSLSLLTINAFTAAKDGLIIPVQCEYLALEGLTQLTQTVDLVKKYLNSTLAVRGLIMTMYDGRTNLSRQVVEEVRAHFPGRVFRTIVPRSVRLSEAPSFGQPISVYAPNSPGGVAYKVLASELIKGDLKEKEGVTS